MFFQLKCLSAKIIFGVKREIILLISHRLGGRVGLIHGAPAGRVLNYGLPWKGRGRRR